MGKPVSNVTKAEQRDNSQAGIVDWDWQAVTPPLQNTAQAWRGCCVPPYIRTHTHTHGLYFQGGCGGWVSMGNTVPGGRETQTAPTRTHQPRGLAWKPDRKRGVRSLWSQGLADAAPTLRPAPAPEDFVFRPRPTVQLAPCQTWT